MNSEYLAWFYDNEEYFSDEGKNIILQSLEVCDESTFQQITKLKLKEPGTAVLLALFCVDRFYLKSTLLGFLKIITLGGFFIWNIIDIFTATKRAKAYNNKSVLQVLNPSAVQYVKGADLVNVMNSAEKTSKVVNEVIDFIDTKNNQYTNIHY